MTDRRPRWERPDFDPLDNGSGPYLPLRTYCDFCGTETDEESAHGIRVSEDDYLTACETCWEKRG